MSAQPTEQFYPSKAVHGSKIGVELERSPGSALTLLSGLVILIGLLAWVWLYDYRWAATGVLLGVALWLVAYHFKSRELQ